MISKTNGISFSLRSTPLASNYIVVACKLKGGDVCDSARVPFKLDGGSLCFGSRLNTNYSVNGSA